MIKWAHNATKFDLLVNLFYQPTGIMMLVSRPLII